MPILVPSDVAPPPPPPPPPYVDPHWHHAFSLVGADGAVWDLVAGPLYITEGAGGFGFADPSHRWRRSAAADQSVYDGMSYGTETFPLPLEVDGRRLGPDGWRDLERRVWRSLSPRGECRLVVTSPSGEAHWRPFRYASGGDEPLVHDALLREDNFYDLEVETGDPFWHGDTVVHEFTLSSTTVATFPGPPFAIGDTSALGDGTTFNPGDEASWWRLTVDGPCSSFDVTVGDAHIAMTSPMSVGRQRIVETSPSGRYIRDESGGLRWREATAKAFVPVPPGETVQITMSVQDGVVGTTGIRLEYDALYRRAFS